MFGIFKKKKSIAEINQEIDIKMQIAQSHGWLLDDIDDFSGPYHRMITMIKETPIKQWSVLFEGGKSHWSEISKRMTISNDNVRVSYITPLMFDNEEKSFGEFFTGTELKDFEDQVLEDLLDIPLLQYLEIVEDDYEETLDRIKNGSGELRSLTVEKMLDMLNFLRAKSIEG